MNPNAPLTDYIGNCSEQSLYSDAVCSVFNSSGFTREREAKGPLV